MVTSKLDNVVQIFANFDEEISRRNFKCVDVTPDVKDGKLQEKIDELFE